MQLDEGATYVVIGTTPRDHRQMKVGDIVGVNLCEPGGLDFRVSIRLSLIHSDGDFEGTTLALQKGKGQRVGGSFTHPAPDLSTRRL